MCSGVFTQYEANESCGDDRGDAAAVNRKHILALRWQRVGEQGEMAAAIRGLPVDASPSRGAHVQVNEEHGLDWCCCKAAVVCGKWQWQKHQHHQDEQHQHHHHQQQESRQERRQFAEDGHMTTALARKTPHSSTLALCKQRRWPTVSISTWRSLADQCEAQDAECEQPVKQWCLGAVQTGCRLFAVPTHLRVCISCAVHAV